LDETLDWIGLTTGLVPSDGVDGDGAYTASYLEELDQTRASGVLGMKYRSKSDVEHQAAQKCAFPGLQSHLALRFSLFIHLKCISFLIVGYP
jgi:hypothetical protein